MLYNVLKVTILDSQLQTPIRNYKFQFNKSNEISYAYKKNVSW